MGAVVRDCAVTFCGTFFIRELDTLLSINVTNTALNFLEGVVGDLTLIRRNLFKIPLASFPFPILTLDNDCRLTISIIPDHSL